MQDLVILSKGAGVIYLLLVHAIGATGGFVAKRMRIPAGAMLGSMLAVVLLNLAAGSDMVYPRVLRSIIQMLSGIVIGCRVGLDDLKNLRRMSLAVGVLVVTLIGINILFAMIISRMTELTPITALFAAAPGGVSDMALIAVEFGANTHQVALLQIVRFVCVLSFFPAYTRKFLIKNNVNSDEWLIQPSHTAIPEQMHIRAGKAGLTILAAGTGAFLGKALGIPAGVVIGSISGTIMVNIFTGLAWLPACVKLCVQIGAGCYIGIQVTWPVIQMLHKLLLPMALTITEVFVMAFVTAFVIHKATRLDKATCLFSSIPGGMTEMGVIAEELKLDLPAIILMHTCRIIAVICVMPLLLHLFAQ